MPAEPQIVIDELSAEVLRRMRLLIEGIRGGPGVNVTTNPVAGITISLSAAAESGFDGESPFEWLKITAKAGGHGKYIGQVVVSAGDTISPDSDLSESEIGVAVNGGNDVLILNVRESGKSTWDLWYDPTGATNNSDNSTLNPTFFLGMYWGASTDGKAVYLIDGLKSVDCVT